MRLDVSSLWHTLSRVKKTKSKKRVSFRLPSSLVKKIQTEAKSRRWTQTTLVVSALEGFFAVDAEAAKV